MKSICFLAIFIASLSSSASAQQPKIGVFDADIMVQLIPGFQSQVDSLVEAFTFDTLQAEYDFYKRELSRLDSSYRSDSSARKPKGVLDLKLRQRNEIGMTVINWERVAQYRIQQKRAFLAAPFYDKVMAAYKKVVAREKYALVLKPNTYEPFTSIENVFVHVAKELNVKLPKELTE